MNHLVGEVNQIWVRRNVPLSCHLNAYLSSLAASACAGVLMIQRGAHSWLTAPHPRVAFSISVRPNGIRSVIIRLFTVHAGLTVNFWDMRPLSSSNLFFSELQHRFISPFWRLVCRARPQTGTPGLCSGSLHGFWSQAAPLFLEQLFRVSTCRLALAAFDLKSRWHKFLLYCYGLGLFTHLQETHKWHFAFRDFGFIKAGVSKPAGVTHPSTQAKHRPFDSSVAPADFSITLYGASSF